MPYLPTANTYQGVADVFLSDPDRYGPLLQFLETIMVGASKLTRAERELIAAHVSKINGCDFCLGAHKWTLSAMDAVPEFIKVIVNTGPDTVDLDDRLRALLTFATKLTETPGDTRQIDIDLLHAAGCTDQEIEDAINVVSAFNYVNRLVDGFGIEAEEPYFKRIGKVLAAQGYAPLLNHGTQKAS